MKRLLISCLCSLLTIAKAIASDHGGRDYAMRDGDSSSAPIWILIIVGFIGYGVYNAFEKDKNGFSGKGCLASIVAVIIAIIIIVMIVNALR